MPDIFLADGAAASSVDRCHSLRSLLPPPAALPSLPTGYSTNAISGFTATQDNNGRLYRCIITDGSGNTVTSNEVKLNTTDFTIYRQPSNAWGILADEANFSVSAYGQGLSYQWQYSSNGGETWKNSPATGNKTNILTNLEINDTRLGLLYRCKITDENGTVLYSNIGYIQLKTDTWTYTYDANGMRTKRTIGNITYEYVYNGGNLSRMTVGDDAMSFGYDANGKPLIVRWAGARYYYVTNIQGDVIAIVSNEGKVEVTYTYDAWGNILSVGGDLANTLGRLNPLRYRGYVYDTETGLYYLQSRYYNPEMGRFINPDDVDLLGANGDFASLNLFAYCGNNPVARADTNGGFWITVGVMAIGGVIGAAIGAASSAITQKALTGTVNWKSVGVAAASGFVSGAVAASPLGIVGQQVAGSIIGGLSYAADCYVNDKEMKLDEAVLSVGMGFVSGRIGGSGANEKMVLSNTYNTAKKTIAREMRRANQAYAQKVIAKTILNRNNVFATTAWTSSFRFAVGTGVANGVMTKYSSIGLLPDAPSWKPW